MEGDYAICEACSRIYEVSDNDPGKCKDCLYGVERRCEKCPRVYRTKEKWTQCDECYFGPQRQCVQCKRAFRTHYKDENPKCAGCLKRIFEGRRKPRAPVEEGWTPSRR